jgi:hypothetical protein
MRMSNLGSQVVKADQTNKYSKFDIHKFDMLKIGIGKSDIFSPASV